MILIATGSEVWVALDAARRRWTRMSASSRCRAGSSSREQPEDYRDEVLPPDVRARLSVEAGIALGWKRWVGDAGDSVAIDRFGASAPGDEVLEKLGFTAENVAARAAALLRARRLVRVAVAFDHRGVKLRERVLEELEALSHDVVDLGTDTAAQRIDYPDKARELGDGDSARRGRARHPRLRLRGRRLGRGVEDRRDPRRGLPRHVLGAPGRRARRHERALPRSRSSAPSSRRARRATFLQRDASTAASATWRGWSKVESDGEARLKAWRSQDCTS